MTKRQDTREPAQLCMKILAFFQARSSNTLSSKAAQMANPLVNRRVDSTNCEAMQQVRKCGNDGKQNQWDQKSFYNTLLLCKLR